MGKYCFKHEYKLGQNSRKVFNTVKKLLYVKRQDNLLKKTHTSGKKIMLTTMGRNRVICS